MSAPGRRRPDDPRIVTLRGAFDQLLESLDATVRIARWQSEGGEAIPEPLEKSASQLMDRLGTATRLASDKFVGAPAVVASSQAIQAAVRELDAAYVAYRKHVDASAADKNEAAMMLDAELGRVKVTAQGWE